MLQTKLYMPKGAQDHASRPRVSRPHLIQKLNTGLHSKLTLVSAPAGYGKTTLIADWLSQLTTINYCWLSLDEDDNDAIRFWSYVLAALKTIDDQWGEASLGTLQSVTPHALTPFVTTFINETNASDSLQAGFVLVLDDYHVIHNRAIHESLTFLLTHMPTHMQLVVTSRADPPFPLSRLRARRLLTEIRDFDLRFNGPETAVFLNQIMHLDLPQEDIVALEVRTEGWVASLQLAALALQSPAINTQDRHQFIANFTGSDRYIVDYLIEEVLQQQTPLIREFLLESAVLDRLCAPLCDYLGLAPVDEPSGQKTHPIASSEILDELDRKNLFLIPMDNQRRWYRYHQLFGDLLRFRLHEIYPGRAAILHQRASQWYADNDFVEDAITHALKAADYSQAAQFIEDAAHELFAQGKMMTLQHWLNQLPPNLIYKRQGLYLLNAWILIRTGQFDAGELHLQRLFPETDTPQSNTRQAEIAHLNSFIAFFQGDFQKSLALNKTAADLLSPQVYELWMPTQSLLAWTYAEMGAVPKSIEIVETVTKVALRLESLTGIISSLGFLAYQYALDDRLLLAESTGKQTIQYAAEHNGSHLPLLGLAYLGMGLAQQKQGQWETAVVHYHQGIDLCQQWGGLIIRTLDGYRLLLNLLNTQGLNQQAQEVKSQLHQLTQQPNIPKWKVRQIYQELDQAVNQTNQNQLPDPLTQREHEILILMAEGLNSSQIAANLIIGVSTVRTHIKRIYAKLDVHSRHEALITAQKYDLLIK